MMNPARPVIRYLGGKWRLAPWIIENLPSHDVYCEPFGGGGSVLLRKPRSLIEIYNDLDDDLVNLFRVLRAPDMAGHLIGQLELTPFARSEWVAAYEHTLDPVERARRLIVRSFMGHSSCASRIDRTTGFRACNLRANADPAKSWATYPEALRLVIARFAGVAIEQRPAEELIIQRDGPEVLFYVDPPYVQSTRSLKQTRCAPSNGYRHELADADHERLLDVLLSVQGKVVLSGYPSAIYDRMLKGWLVVKRQAMADGGRERTEVLWLNPAAATAGEVARPVHHQTLFENANGVRTDPGGVAVSA
tara:strand:- start:11215 stop:12129 length:915 start_codon:yes stop_codon:yes gene_type:complete